MNAIDIVAAFTVPDKSKRNLATYEIATGGESVIPDLISLLSDGNWVIRYRAAETLGKIGLVRDDVIAALTKLADDEKDHVRYMAVKSLTKLSPAKSEDVFIRLLSDEHHYTRGMAATGLILIGNKASINSLKSAIAVETNPEIKEKIQNALEGTGLNIR